jgi:hypothetical protein
MFLQASELKNSLNQCGRGAAWHGLILTLFYDFLVFLFQIQLALCFGLEIILWEMVILKN